MARNALLLRIRVFYFYFYFFKQWFGKVLARPPDFLRFIVQFIIFEYSMLLLCRHGHTCASVCKCDESEGH